MGQEYALDWLDQMVQELDPQRIRPENLDNHQAMAIVDKAAKEEKQLILLSKQFVFQEQKTKQIRNTWFIQEIDFHSKTCRIALNDPGEQPQKPGKKYERNTSDKILCNLTVDQLSLFFKAADLSNIISARSLSAIFQAVAPYLSTPHRTEISHSSLRVKSYSVEDLDKSLLIDIMTRLTEQIKDL